MIAAFDADGTIWKEDSFNEFIKWLTKNKFPYLYHSFGDYLKLEQVDPLKAYRRAPLFFKGHHKGQLRQQAEAFAEVFQFTYIHKTLEKIKEAKSMNKKVIVVSATPSIILEPILKPLKVDKIMGLELATNSEGIITGKVTGVPTIFKGKSKAIKQYFPNEEISLSVGNSFLDYPMLSMATDESIAIDPDRKLLEVARNKNWKVFFN